MGFVKVGDANKIESVFDNEGELIVCENCNEPITIIAMDENSTNTMCKCEKSNLEQLDA